MAARDGRPQERKGVGAEKDVHHCQRSRTADTVDDIKTSNSLLKYAEKKGYGDVTEKGCCGR